MIEHIKNRSVDSRVNFEKLVDNNIAGLLYLENDVIVFSNPSFAKVLGTTVDDLLNTSILDWVGSTDKLLLSQGLERMYSGENDEFSDSLMLKGNQQKFFSLHLKVVGSSDGKFEIVGASRDATDRVVKNILLDREHSRYNALFENSVACIMIYNYDKEKIVDCNKAAIKIMEYSDKPDMLGRSRLDFVPQTSPYFQGVDLHEATKEHGISIKNGISFNTRGVFLTKSGKPFLVQASLTPTFYEYGEGFIIFHDVTNEVLAKKAQKESDKKYKDIFNNLHEAVIYIDIKKEETILCNDNALELFDVDTIDEFKKKRPKDYFFDKYNEGIDPDEFITSGYARAITDGKANVAFWMKKKDGRKVRVNGILIGDTSRPNEPRIIAFLRDETNLFNAKKHLNQKNNELKKYIDSNMQLENFAYLASHDLQTPIRSIISFTQLLERKLGDKLAKDEKEYLDYIVQSGKNMRNLINDLLSYSRVNTTKINLTKINLRRLLFDVCTDMSSDIKKSEAYVEILEVPEIIKADATKIKQIFQNLIINSIKFSREGLAPEVKVSCLDKVDHWQFSVEDNGIGIEEEYQEKIFLLFKRLHIQTEYEGTGIGLAMVKKLVEQHEGEIWLESEINQGTKFYFTIKK